MGRECGINHIKNCLMSSFKKIFRKLSSWTLWQEWSTSDTLKFIPITTLHWFAILAFGVLLSVIFATISIFAMSDGVFNLKTENDSKHKNPSVLNVAELDKILDEYKIRSKMHQDLKRNTPSAIDPSL